MERHAPHFSEKTQFLKLEGWLQPFAFAFAMISFSLAVFLVFLHAADSEFRTESLEQILLLTLCLSLAGTLLILAVMMRMRRSWLAIEQESGLDPVSGTSSRMNFEKMLEEELRRSGRYHYALSLCCLDLDHFKMFNEEHGPRKANELLKRFGSFLRRTIRFADCVCRFQNDEFCILLPHTDIVKAQKFMKRLAALAKQDLELRFSAGVTSYQTGESKTAFVQRAFSALHQAKQEGSGQVRYLVSEQPVSAARS